MNDEIEIMAYCISEKENVSLGFGCSFDPEKDRNWKEETERIFDGMSESFMENFEEFYPGIQKALSLIEMDPSLTYRQALYKIFGHFRTVFEIDGKETDNNVYDIDFEDDLYNLLENRDLYWIE